MPAKVFIETPRLILRQWKASDHEPYIQLNQDSEVMEFFPSLLTRDESLAHIDRFTKHIDQYGYGFFALERKDTGQFIGFTGLSHPRFEAPFTPCVEIGWRLSKAHWGEGFATEAALATLDFGFGSIGLDEIYAFTSVHNKKSEQVMLKAGMLKQGEFEHPQIEAGHFLKQHVLYRISRPPKI